MRARWPGVGEAGVAIGDDAAAMIAGVDAVIDFTAPDVSVRHADLAAQAGAAIVIGTTGMGPAHIESLERAARHAPVVFAPNMSVGVTLLMALVEQVARTLDDSYDIEIVEMHHRHKVDAPSGTALGLGRAAAAGRGVDLDEAGRLSREGHTGARPRGEIGFATLRGGDVVGDHTVCFAAEGERHRADPQGLGPPDLRRRRPARRPVDEGPRAGPLFDDGCAGDQAVIAPT